MEHPAPAGRSVTIGDFHLDLDSGELLRDGTRVRLQVQSLELLKALLERPGAMVAREDLRRRLWPDDTFVDFEHGINAGVRRLRESFGDTADSPRYVETVPRKGYRLIAPTDAGPAGQNGGPRQGVPSVPEPVPQPSGVPARRALTVPARWWWLAGIVVVVAGGLAAWSRPALPAATSRPPVALLTIDVPDGWSMRYWDLPAVSPDSRHLAFSATGPQGGVALWVRPLGGSTARQIAPNAQRPFWSPDSGTIGFFSFGMLATVPLAGGTVKQLAPAPLNGGGTWMSNGDILFTPIQGRAVHRLASGAAPSQAVPDVLAARAPEALSWPSAVPGTERFTFLSRRGTPPVLVGAIGGVGDATSADLGPVDSRVIATASGHLLWVSDGTLLAQRLDASRTRLVGSPTPIAQDVAVRSATLGHFSASDDVVVFLTQEAATAAVRLSKFDRGGAIVGAIGEVGEYSSPRVSPDGTRVAVGRRDPRAGTRDLWVHDLTGKPPLRLTFDRHDDTAPVWSADGRTVFFSSDRQGERDLYRKDAAGQQPEVLVFASAESKSLNAVSRDGRTLVYDTGARGSVDTTGRFNSSDLRMVSVGATPTVKALADTPAHEDMADLSPDGSLVAYHSSDRGSRTEIFVETFPNPGGRWQVTTGGGADPVWRADGRELFFMSPGGKVSAVDVERTATGVRFGPARVLFTVPKVHTDVRRFAPFPDGRHFIVLTDAERPAPQHMTVLMNWRSALPD